MSVRRSLLITLSILILASVIFHTVRAQSPAGIVRAAWKQAEQIGNYHFTTDVEIESHPLPLLVNAGRSTTTERMFLEGSTDRQNESMTFAMYSGSNDRLEFKVEDGESFGRTSQTDWQPVDNVTDLFAPGNDTLAYLTAAQNIRLKKHEFAPRSPFIPQHTIYSFDLDGVAFAAYMQQQLEEQLQRQGRLPLGLHVEVSDTWLEMTGTGEIWLDEAGFPLRLVINAQLPPDGTEQADLHITTDFSGWDKMTPIALQGHLVQAVNALPTPDIQAIVMQAVVLLTASFVAFALLFQRRDRAFSKVVVLAIVFYNVFAPFFHLVPSAHAADFVHNTGTVHQEPINPVQPETDLPTPEAESTVGSGGHDTPLELSEQPSSDRSVMMEMSSDDTDGDGLTDVMEMTMTMTDPALADTDNDGLNDGIEVNKLGTLATNPDTDGDLISDGREVHGFRLDDDYYYLDPLNADSNNDGNIDAVDCADLIDIDPSVEGMAQVLTLGDRMCADTDGDLYQLRSRMP